MKLSIMQRCFLSPRGRAECTRGECLCELLLLSQILRSSTVSDAKDNSTDGLSKCYALTLNPNSNNASTQASNLGICESIVNCIVCYPAR